MKYLFCRQQPKGDWVKFQTDEMESYSLLQYDDFIKYIQVEVEDLIDYNRFMFELSSFQLITVLKSGEWQVDYDEAKSKTAPAFMEVVKFNEQNKKDEDEPVDFLTAAVELFKGKKKTGPTRLPWFEKNQNSMKLSTDLSKFRNS